MTDTPRRPQAIRALAHRHLLGLSLTLLALAGIDSVAAADAQNARCLRCHAMSTLAYRDSATGDIVDLSIDPQILSHSVHGELACTECHRRSYKRYPHPERLSNEDFSCVGCHEDDPEDARYHFRAIQAEYARSVHATSDDPHARGFSCHSCHDPHAFRASLVGDDMAEVVRSGNAVCLSCHKRLSDPLDTSHAWLPRRDAHWASVRCIDCHTPIAEEPSHQILPAKDSARNCVECHAKDSQLLNRLYRYRSEEDRAQHGWLASALFNEAYIVGMSRNRLIDALSLAVIALVLVVIAIHAIGRYRVHKARQERP